MKDDSDMGLVPTHKYMHSAHIHVNIHACTLHTTYTYVLQKISLCSMRDKLEASEHGVVSLSKQSL